MRPRGSRSRGPAACRSSRRRSRSEAAGGPSCPTTRRAGASDRLRIRRGRRADHAGPIRTITVLTRRALLRGAGRGVRPASGSDTADGSLLERDVLHQRRELGPRRVLFPQQGRRRVQPPARRRRLGNVRGPVRQGDPARDEGLMWSRRIDFNERNPTGTVNHAEYCAPANALLSPGDAAKCCSRATRGLNAAESRPRPPHTSRSSPAVSAGRGELLGGPVGRVGGGLPLGLGVRGADLGAPVAPGDVDRLHGGSRLADERQDDRAFRVVRDDDGLRAHGHAPGVCCRS